MSLPTNLAKPNTMIAGTDALAAHVNSNFDYVLGALNTTNTDVNANTAEIVSARSGELSLDARIDSIAATANAAMPANYLDTDATLSANSDTKVPSQKAVKAHVTAAAFSTALPSQTGNAGKFVTTDGTNASWSALKTLNSQSLLGEGDIALPAGFPIGGMVGFGSNITANQVNVADAVYLKTGVIDDASLYPDMPSAPYATVTSATIGAASTVTGSLASNGSNIVVRATNGSNQYFLSTDGGWSYTSRSNSVSFGNGITYGNGVFVATVSGISANVMTSSDGATWTIHTGALPASVSWRSVIFCNGIFLATSDSTTYAARSVDGVTWTSITLPDVVSLARMAYGNGIYVLIQSGGNVMYTSPDLTTWTSRYVTFSNNMRDVAFTNGIFVLTGYDDANSIKYSANGTSWTSASTALNYLDSHILVKDSVFNVWLNGSRYYSSNGSTWSNEGYAVYPAADRMTKPMLAVSDGFVSINFGGYLVRSATGLTWARQQLSGHNATAQLVYGDGWWLMPVATGNAGDYTLGWSKDGQNWAQIQTYFAGVSTTPQFRQAAYFGGKWYIYSEVDNKLWSSTNKIDWTEVTKPWTSPSLFNVTNNLLFIHRTSAVTSMYYTADGATWLTTGSFPSATTYRHIVYGNGTYVLSGSGANQLYYTTDLSASWTAATLPASLTIYHVVFDGTRFIASVTDTAISLIESTDGVTWTAVPSKYNGGTAVATQHGFAISNGKACFTTAVTYEYTTTSEGRYLRSVTSPGSAGQYAWFATDGSNALALQTTACKTTAVANDQILNDINYKVYNATAGLQSDNYMRVK